MALNRRAGLRSLPRARLQRGHLRGAHFIDPTGLAKRKPGEKTSSGDTCDGVVINGVWEAGEPVDVNAKDPGKGSVPYPKGMTQYELDRLEWEFYRNMQSAGSHRNDGVIENYRWFYQQVRSKGPVGLQRKYRGAEDFGNFHFAAAGRAAGIPAGVLSVGAGVYSAYEVFTAASKVSKLAEASWMLPYPSTPVPGAPQLPFAQFPYGDDPNDAINVLMGSAFGEEYP